MKNTALPKSKAKTAYGLLSEVRKLILAEPKRYNQWLVWRRYKVRELREQPALPSCGSVGCVAGWVSALKTPHTKNEIDAAGRILGLNDSQLSQLVYCRAAGARVPTDLEGHARRGASHIRAFQRKFAAQLKAKAV